MSREKFMERLLQHCHRFIVNGGRRTEVAMKQRRRYVAHVLIEAAGIVAGMEISIKPRAR